MSEEIKPETSAAWARDGLRMKSEEEEKELQITDCKLQIEEFGR